MAPKADRRQRFVELAEKRMTKALRQIKLVGNLADQSNYEYSDVDAKKILAALQQAVEECGVRFEQGGMDSDETFKL